MASVTAPVTVCVPCSGLVDVCYRLCSLQLSQWRLLLPSVLLAVVPVTAPVTGCVPCSGPSDGSCYRLSLQWPQWRLLLPSVTACVPCSGLVDVCYRLCSLQLSQWRLLLPSVLLAVVPVTAPVTASATPQPASTRSSSRLPPVRAPSPRPPTTVGSPSTSACRTVRRTSTWRAGSSARCPRLATGRRAESVCWRPPAPTTSSTSRLPASRPPSTVSVTPRGRANLGYDERS